MSKLVTVYGATGAQGGSVVRALLRDRQGPFQVRAITRNPDSDTAKALAADGVEVVKANGLVKEELIAAFKNSWAVFANTNSDDPTIGVQGTPTETDVGRIVVDAAVEAGVKYFIYSALSSASRITNGAISSLCFDEKHAIADYARSQTSIRTVAVSPGWYLENFLVEEWAPYLGGLPFVRDSDGYYTISWPHWGGNNEVPLIAIERDFGDLVHGVLLAPDRWVGKTVQAISQSRALEEFGADFEKATGNKARYVPLEDWRAWKTDGTRVMETVKEMFGFCQYSGGLYYGTPNDVGPASELKAVAAHAQGKSGEDTRLITLQEYFKAAFA